MVQERRFDDEHFVCNEKDACLYVFAWLLLLLLLRNVCGVFLTNETQREGETKELDFCALRSICCLPNTNIRGIKKKMWWMEEQCNCEIKDQSCRSAPDRRDFGQHFGQW